MRPKQRILVLLGGADGGGNFSEQVSQKLSAQAQENGHLFRRCLCQGWRLS